MRAPAIWRAPTRQLWPSPPAPLAHGWPPAPALPLPASAGVGMMALAATEQEKRQRAGVPAQLTAAVASSPLERRVSISRGFAAGAL